MRIIDLQCIVLRVPIERPIRVSFGGSDVRQAFLLLIQTDEGITGLGETWVNYPSWALEERMATVKKGVIPLILGKNPLEREALMGELRQRLLPLGRQWGAIGIIYQILSGIEIALLDLAGKVAGKPISVLLGGKGGLNVPVYASGLVSNSIQEQEVSEIVEKGFTGIKVKCGFDFEKDLEGLKRLRNWIGPKISLMVDANQGWTVEEAIRFIHEAQSLDIKWFEEPIPADNLAGMAQIRSSTGAQIAGGENWYGEDQPERALLENAVDIVQPDVVKTGGLLSSISIAQKAVRLGRTFAFHSFTTAVCLTASLHAFSAQAGGLNVEMDVTENLFMDQLLSTSFTLSEGCVRCPAGPGLGIEINPDMIVKYRVDL